MVKELTEAAKEVAGNLQEPAAQAVEEVKSTATDAAQTVRKDESASAAGDVKEQAAESKEKVQSASGDLTRDRATRAGPSTNGPESSVLSGPFGVRPRRPAWYEIWSDAGSSGYPAALAGCSRKKRTISAEASGPCGSV